MTENYLSVPFNQTNFSQLLTSSSQLLSSSALSFRGDPSSDLQKRLQKKQNLIQFYEQQKTRREELQQLQKKQKIHQYRKIIQQLKFLIELEHKRQTDLTEKININQNINRLSTEENNEESLRFSLDTCEA